MDKKLLKNIGIAFGAILFFLGLSYGFVPQVLNNKVVHQVDISGYYGMSNEMSEWNKAHPDDPTYWTDAMFGGMPTAAISTKNGGDATQAIYDFLLLGRRPATYLFIALLGSFLLMLSLGISWPLAIGGAVAIAFCSYNFQIIQVGHNTKMQAIAFFPWVLAALVYTYRSIDSKRRWLAKVLLGAVLFGLALSMQVKANHQQITYYLALLVMLYALVIFIDILVRKEKDSLVTKTVRKTRVSRFFIASALLLVVGLVGVATNVNKLLPIAKYTPNTMRGGSELTKEGGTGKSRGLDLEYATAWSYGWNELPNLLIPNFNGGASSQPIDPAKSETVRLLKEAGQTGTREIAKSLPLYWGPQPYTAGPMYMGAITVFLFVLGLFLYKGKDKWWIVAGTVLAILLAVGNHFMAFTKLCFKILPLYNKFRTVSMALVILQVTLPVLGFLTLDKIVKDGYDRKAFLKKSSIAFALTGGLCLLFFLIPTLAGDFTGPSDAGQPDVVIEAFQADRIALLRHDALQSFLLVAAAWAILLWAGLSEEKNPVRKVIASLALCLLVLVNLFATGKRYLNDDHFTTMKDFRKPFEMRVADNLILADPDPSYRVLDLSVSVFNSAVPSFRHKSVGGYSPAKLQRYQDLIDYYLVDEINQIYTTVQQAETLEKLKADLPEMPVLSALNTRYLILSGDFLPIVNTNAFGTAWFVDEVVPAATPDEEIAFLGKVDLRRQAVVGKDMPAVTAAAPTDTTDAIVMTSYAPNELRYHYTASTDRLAVFSEIYYPNGWRAKVDGEPVDIFRADWTLRAAKLPAGEHDIVMRFDPDSYRIGANVSRASSITLLILLIFAVVGIFLPARKKE